MYGPIARTAASTVFKRTFASIQRRAGSSFHYAEGPRSNLPFNTQTRFFAVRYWLFMAAGFGFPIGEAIWQTYKNK